MENLHTDDGAGGPAPGNGLLADAGSRPNEPEHSSVLIADDDPLAQRWLKGLLSKWGYSVTATMTGPAALEILESDNPPLLAILDWEMPGMGGVEVCRQLRSRSRSRYTYVILLTARDQQQDLVEGLGAGADEYIKKPVDATELRARVEAGVRLSFQKALRESEQRFSNAVECSAVGMALLGLDGAWQQINQAFASFLGYSKEEMMRMSFQELTHPDDVAHSVEMFRALAAGNPDSYQLEKRYLRKGGQAVWVLLTVSLMRNSGGSPAYAVAQLQDISKSKRSEEALQKSEALFRAISENAAELILVVDRQGFIHYASPAYLQLLGFPAELIQGEDMFAVLFAQEEHEFIQQRIEAAISGVSADAIQMRLRNNRGDWHTAESHVGVIRSAQGEVDRLVVTARLIDDWIAAQEVLQDREEQLKLLLDSTAEAIYGLDMNGNCTFCNTAFLRTMGYETVDELLGQNIHRLIHHHYADGSLYPVTDCKIYKSLHSGAGSHVIDEVLWRTDGSSFPSEYWSFPVRKNGEVVGGVVTFFDITDRKAAADALRVAHSESELVINSVPSILIGLDSRGRITQWNLAAENTFGLGKTQVAGLNLEDCGIKWLSPTIREEINGWLQVATTRRFENIRFEKEHETRFLGITVSSVDWPNERTKRVLITGADTTERKILEEQLKQAQKLEAVGQLAAGIAHEINTPTQFVGDNIAFLRDSWESIKSLLEQVRLVRSEAAVGPIQESSLEAFDRIWNGADVDYLEKEVPQAIEQSQEGLRRVSKIVKAMREFSHPGSEEKRPVDLNRAIETTITVASNEWKYVADVETNLDRSLPMVPCLGQELNQAILNLIVNAAHAIADVVGDGSKTKGRIIISTQRDGEWVEVSVRDTGTGIPEEIRSRVFEPFFTTKQVGKGTGQGLALAHAAIVKKQGGQIWFESEIGKGTTFFVRLPLGPTASVLDTVKPLEREAPLGN